MESKTKNRKSREQIARMVERSFGGITLAAGEDAVSELTDGWFNAAYTVRLSDGREAILKIAPPKDAEVMSYEKNIMAAEVASMRQVRANPAIPVPQIYYYDTALDLCDSEYFFMEKLSGDGYSSVKASLAPEIRAQIDRQIGAIIREINGFTGTYFGYPGNTTLRGETWKEAFIRIMDAVLEDGLAKNAVFGTSIGDIRAAILKHAPSLEAVTTPRMVHWDAGDPNFFVKHGQVTGIIDLERVLWADPLMEVQFRALHYGGISESMVGYGKTTFTHQEMERCNLYTLYLGLIMVVEYYFRDPDSDFGINIGRHLTALSLSWLQEN